MSADDVESRTLPQFDEHGDLGATRIACAAGNAAPATANLVKRRSMAIEAQIFIQRRVIVLEWDVKVFCGWLWFEWEGDTEKSRS